MTEPIDNQNVGSERTRRKRGLREVLGRVVATFASLFILTGVLSPFYADSSHKWNWVAAVALVLLGLFLGFCAALIAWPDALSGRPPLWFPAVSGFACSCFVLTIFACAAIYGFSSATTMPGGLRTAIALSFVGAVLSALVCIITGIAALLRRKKEPTKPSTPP
jgi:apolipoprotein N-acyltransferase